MSAYAIALSIFGGLFASALLAMRARMRLSEEHLSGSTQDTVKLTMGLVATMTALVLGLLVASTKEAYDTERSEVTQMTAKIVYLDRVLAGYGPESGSPRDLLRHTVERALILMWPDEKFDHSLPAPTTSWSEALPGAIQKLSPRDDIQRAAKDEAASLATDLGQMRWLLFEQAETAISKPMLAIVICWLAILFFSFGLFAPPNRIAAGALLVAALSVSGAIFLILELDHPFDGFVQISSRPMRNALVELGK